MNKIQIDSDLVKRLKNAAFNGSTVAKYVLEAIASGKELKSKNANYFSSCRVIKRLNNGYGFDKISIKIYCCNKDLSGKHPDSGNPNASLYKENRTEISVTTFAKYFIDNEKQFSQEEYDYLENIISINSKLKVVVSNKTADFTKAYDESNYSLYGDADVSSLHKSCMRDGKSPTNAADFYSNFAGASIIYVVDENNLVYGRAVLWTKAFFKADNAQTSFLERVYCCFASIRKMIIKKATDMGIIMRKTKDSYDTPKEFTLLNKFESWSPGDNLTFNVYVIPKCDANYKAGVPYTDTIEYAYTDPDTGQLRLGNYYPDGHLLASFRQTGGLANKHRDICPICGRVTEGGGKICRSCLEKYTIDTYIGRIATCGFTPYFGVMYPSVCFEKDGKTPGRNMLNSIALEKTYHSH